MITTPKDPEYRRWISRLPCSISGCTCWPSDPAHTGSRIEHQVGMGQKTPDWTCVPLCRVHHSEQHTIGMKSFVEKYKLDFPSTVAQLRSTYTADAIAFA